MGWPTTLEVSSLMGTDNENTSLAAWTRCKESCNVADCRPLMTGRTPNGTRPCREGIRSPIPAARPSPTAAGSGTTPRTFIHGLPPPPHAPRPLSSRGVLVPCPVNVHPGVDRILLHILP